VNYVKLNAVLLIGIQDRDVAIVNYHADPGANIGVVQTLRPSCSGRAGPCGVRLLVFVQ
jgi:hypothetical protein